MTLTQGTGLVLSQSPQTNYASSASSRQIRSLEQEKLPAVKLEAFITSSEKFQTEPSSLRELAVSLRQAETEIEAIMDQKLNAAWSHISQWRIAWVGHFDGINPSDTSYATRGCKFPIMVRVSSGDDHSTIECLSSRIFDPKSQKQFWSIKLDCKLETVSSYRNGKLQTLSVTEKEFLLFLADKMDLPKIHQLPKN